MRVLVTGGGGFVGSNLIRRFLNEGVEVVVIDDFSTGERENLVGLDLQVFENSILDRDALATASRGVTSIVHLAAIPSVPRSIKFPVASHEANVTGTVNVLEAARKEDAQVVFASSSSVYGRNTQLPKSESMHPMPVSPYAVGKLAAETYSLVWSETYEIPVVPFRFFNIFGPRQLPGHAYAAVIPTLSLQSLKGESLTIHGDGLQTRDFTYIDSVTQVLARTVYERLSSNSPVNLAFGSRTSVLQVAELIAEITGLKLHLEHQQSRAGDVRDSQANSTLLSSMFPDLVVPDFRESLEATVNWLKSWMESHRSS